MLAALGDLARPQPLTPHFYVVALAAAPLPYLC
jgi:hypothetical protein